MIPLLSAPTPAPRGGESLPDEAERWPRSACGGMPGRHSHLAVACSLLAHAAAVAWAALILPNATPDHAALPLAVSLIAIADEPPAPLAAPEPEAAGPATPRAVDPPPAAAPLSKPVAEKPMAHRPKPPQPAPAPAVAASPDSGAPPQSDAAASGATTTEQPEAPAAAPPATASGGGAADPGGDDMLRAYGEAVWSRIVKMAPKKVRQRGTVTIAFHICPDGSLQWAKVEASSGNDSLDQAALDWLHATEPFDPPPSELAPERLTFVLPFRFR